MIDLNDFVANKYEVRTYLQIPSSVDIYTIATNGHIMVRVPRRDDIAPVEGYPKVESITRHSDGEKEFVDIPQVDKPADMVVCDTCYGTGRFADDTCDFCYDGLVETDIKYIDIGHSRFDQKYIYKLNQLPNAKISINEEIEGCAYIKFDGGDAFLMPVRKR